jgi:urease accessory protein
MDLKQDSLHHLGGKLDPLLFLLQLSDSALPIGSYSHSWGLETAVQEGRLTTEREVYEYLLGVLYGSLVPYEGRACFWAHEYSQQQDEAKLLHLQARLNASRWAFEPRQASLALGRRLRQIMAKTWELSCPDGLHHCLVFGWICGQAHIAPEETVKAYLFNSLMSLVSASVRLVPLGHSEGQDLLAQFHRAVTSISSETLREKLFSSFTFLQERDCQVHQTLYSRLFQS